ncbi:hypothetical protein Scep_004028 [Stephania cephalantha]|uniref:TATA element modulatory factor 1 TATA binding domain-containing protein n=1 Tax=Stephania cephalantha TaxID=152367 RepID=A0AAP0KUH1_9MAGN
MAWLGKVSLGNFPDLAGAVNKLSESVKNIEKNFDSALGFEEKSDSGEALAIWPSATETKALFQPVMSFMGQRSGESEITGEAESSKDLSSVREDELPPPVIEQASVDKETEGPIIKGGDEVSRAQNPTKVFENPSEAEHNLQSSPIKTDHGASDLQYSLKQEESAVVSSNKMLTPSDPKSQANIAQQFESSSSNRDDGLDSGSELKEPKMDSEACIDKGAAMKSEALDGGQAGGESETSISGSAGVVNAEISNEFADSSISNIARSDGTTNLVDESLVNENDFPRETSQLIEQIEDSDTRSKDRSVSSEVTESDYVHSRDELETMKREIKMMEAALQGAARQAQAKADEIAKLMNENEQLKNVIENLKVVRGCEGWGARSWEGGGDKNANAFFSNGKMVISMGAINGTPAHLMLWVPTIPQRKSNESDESLREEYHQKLSALERKVYALTKERDTLRREQSKKSDAAALLKEKDEIINQVMAEGEELSKKQAAQESTIRKLRAQIREFEEEKKGLITKLQAEENKVESIKKDKAATEKFLQETIEKHQAELASQKEHYTNALNAAREAEALAEARANNEARTELESRLREVEERESTLVQTLEELRQTLSRKEQQAVFREDMLQRDIDDLQKRYQASERRCEELITQVPESTRPLLRQIEAMQETTAKRAEAWAGVERALNARLQEAEAKAAVAEENERTMNERLSQTLSRMAVLEAQVSCLRAEQIQLSRSLEKERQRASENKQEYLAAQEAVATLEVRAKQFDEEMRELKRKHKQELQELMTQKELLQQELEAERLARSDLERATQLKMSTTADQAASTHTDNGTISNRKLSSAGSLSSMEESFFLQASLDSSDSFAERRHSESTMTPYFLKSMTPSAFEATLRQKDGELASYMSRLTSLESIRDSLAEELVKMTAQCEKLRTEAALLPGLRAELEALRRRHAAALELMGERDEELEELRADIVDVKEMYREQINLLVNKPFEPRKAAARSGGTGRRKIGDGSRQGARQRTADDAAAMAAGGRERASGSGDAALQRSAPAAACDGRWHGAVNEVEQRRGGALPEQSIPGSSPFEQRKAATRSGRTGRRKIGDGSRQGARQRTADDDEQRRRGVGNEQLRSGRNDALQQRRAERTARRSAAAASHGGMAAAAAPAPAW